MPGRIAIGLFLLALAVAATAERAPARHDDAESRLVTALDQMRTGRHERAGKALRALTEARPDFRLAHFLYGEWLNLQAGRPVAAAAGPAEAELLAEARLRWRHRKHPPPKGAVPNALLRLAPQHKHAVVVDLNAHRLYLFRNDGGRARLQGDFYASIGSGGTGKLFEGDLRTPVGVYRIDGFKPDARLPERYGDGALTLNYPNAWDRFFGRTGHGIWVHGVPRDTYSRPPLASEGCVVIANDDLSVLRTHVTPGVTPVVFTDELRWITPDEALGHQREVLAALRDWRRHRASGDTRGASAHYADTFMLHADAGDGGRPTFRRRVAMTIDAGGGLEDVSVFAYPGEPDLIMTAFAGRGAAPVASGQRTTLFWRRMEKGWRIVHESRR